MPAGDGLINVDSFLSRAASRCGFVREQYEDARVPNTPSSVVVLPFFGDYRAEFVTSTLLLHRYMEVHRPGAYLIVASWPGHAALWPYADEYWGVADAALAGDGQAASRGFDNRDQRLGLVFKKVFQTFENCVETEQLARYYDRGLTQAFFDQFGDPAVVMPGLRPLPADLNRLIGRLAGNKVFLTPTRSVWGWEKGTSVGYPVPAGFWAELANRLADEGYCPVVWQSRASHDISAAVAGRCTVFDRDDMGDVLSAMRSCDVVLDYFGDVHRLAALARCPYVSVQERGKFVATREHELDDVCVENPRRRYVFSFHALLNARQWGGLCDAAVAPLAAVLEGSDRASWPAAGERRQTVQASSVRERRSSRLGVRFVKMPRPLGL